MKEKAGEKGKRLLSRGHFLNGLAGRMSGTKFKAFRLEMGLTQEALGKLLDLTTMQISRYENDAAPVPRSTAIHVLLLAGRVRV